MDGVNEMFIICLNDSNEVAWRGIGNLTSSDVRAYTVIRWLRVDSFSEKNCACLKQHFQDLSQRFWCPSRKVTHLFSFFLIFWLQKILFTSRFTILQNTNAKQNVLWCYSDHLPSQGGSTFLCLEVIYILIFPQFKSVSIGFPDDILTQVLTLRTLWYYHHHYHYYHSFG